MRVPCPGVFVGCAAMPRVPLVPGVVARKIRLFDLRFRDLGLLPAAQNRLVRRDLRPLVPRFRDDPILSVMCIFFFCASGEKLLVRVQSGPRAVVSDLFLQLRHGTAYLAAGSRTADFLHTPLRGVVLALGPAAASFVVPRVGTPFRKTSPVVSVLLGCHGAVCSCMGRFFFVIPSSRP